MPNVINQIAIAKDDVRLINYILTDLFIKQKNIMDNDYFDAVCIMAMSAIDKIDQATINMNDYGFTSLINQR